MGPQPHHRLGQGTRNTKTRTGKNFDMSKRHKDKGRIPGQWTAIRWELMESRAWKQMSMGARMLYIALIKPLSFNRDNNGKIFLATRNAAEELGANQRVICIWFRELEHYGFIVMTEPGNSVRVPRWRITDVGWGVLDGKSIEATKDYLKWDGVLFERCNPDGSYTKSKRLDRYDSSSLRGRIYLRGSEEESTSLKPKCEEESTSEGTAQCEEESTSDLVQPSHHPLGDDGPDVAAKCYRLAEEYEGAGSAELVTRALKTATPENVLAEIREAMKSGDTLSHALRQSE
jgi:hypothetical protein